MKLKTKRADLDLSIRLRKSSTKAFSFCHNICSDSQRQDQILVSRMTQFIKGHRE